MCFWLIGFTLADSDMLAWSNVDPEVGWHGLVTWEGWRPMREVGGRSFHKESVLFILSCIQRKTWVHFVVSEKKFVFYNPHCDFMIYPISCLNSFLTVTICVFFNLLSIYFVKFWWLIHFFFVYQSLFWVNVWFFRFCHSPFSFPNWLLGLWGQLEVWMYVGGRGHVGKAIDLYESPRVVFEVLFGLCIMVNFVHEVTAWPVGPTAKACGWKVY